MVEGGKERRGEGGRGEEDRGTLNNLPPSEASLPQQAAAIPRTPHVSLTFAPLHLHLSTPCSHSPNCPHPPAPLRLTLSTVLTKMSVFLRTRPSFSSAMVTISLSSGGHSNEKCSISAAVPAVEGGKGDG